MTKQFSCFTYRKAKYRLVLAEQEDFYAVWLEKYSKKPRRQHYMRRTMINWYSARKTHEFYYDQRCSDRLHARIVFSTIRKQIKAKDYSSLRKYNIIKLQIKKNINWSKFEEYLKHRINRYTDPDSDVGQVAGAIFGVQNVADHIRNLRERHD